MKLFYTPKSHFSRKVRILVGAYNNKAITDSLQLVDIGNVGSNKQNEFGPNPMMKVPTLLDGDNDNSNRRFTEVFDSDNIAQYLVREKFKDEEDKFQVLHPTTKVLNARAIMNTVMSNEVELILARRSGLDTTKHVRFEKHLQGIRQGLEWLESNADLIFPGESTGMAKPTYAGFHLTCLFDHLRLYDVVPTDEYKNLNKQVSLMSKLPYVEETYPR
jgi:glutathione S-transferase